MPRVTRRSLNVFLTVRVATVLSFIVSFVEAAAGFAIILAFMMRSAAVQIPFVLALLENVALIGTIIAYIILFLVLFVAGRLVMYVIRLLITWVLIFLSMGVMIYYSTVIPVVDPSLVYSAMIVFMFLSIIFYAGSWGSRTLLRGLEEHKVSLERLEEQVGRLSLSERESEQLGRLIASTKKSWSKIARDLAESMDLAKVFYKSLIVSVVFFGITIFISTMNFQISLYSYAIGLIVTLLLSIALIIIDTTRIEKMRKELIRSAI